MEKRLVLAIALSLLVLLSWSVLAPKPQITGNNIVTENKLLTLSSSQQTISTTAPAITVLPLLDTGKETVKFIQNNREIIFDPSLAAVVEVIFRDGPEHRLPLKIGFLTEGSFIFKQTGIFPVPHTEVLLDGGYFHIK